MRACNVPNPIDVDKNSDLFYKEVPDGAYALAFGPIPGVAKPLLIVGGNCSINVRR